MDSTVPESLEREYSAQEWLNLYSIPHISMVTLLPPELYLFYSNVNVPSSVLSSTNQASLLNAGEFFILDSRWLFTLAPYLGVSLDSSPC